MQQLPQEPGRRGMGVPDYQLMTQLLGQDMKNRNIPGPPQGQLADALHNPQGALPSIDTSNLLDVSRQAREGGNMDMVRALRSVIEGRTSDDFARGPGPRQPEAQGKTSAEKLQFSGSQDHGLGVFGKLSRALFGANNAGR